MTILETIQNKIISQKEINKILSATKNKKLVFTNGCFDILHQGHISYLAQASEIGDILIIGLNSDLSVKKLKGKNRPVQDEKSRALILAALQFVDYIIIFEEETPYNLISKIQPDFLIKGGDYEIKNIVGYDIVNKKGGQILTIPFIDGYSSTNIINSI